MSCLDLWCIQDPIEDVFRGIIANMSQSEAAAQADLGGGHCRESKQ